MTATALEQERRRQAMLQVMGLEVWLPRQPLPHAAAARPLLLDWTASAALPAVPVAKPRATPEQLQPVASGAPQRPVIADRAASVQASLQQVRQSLEGGEPSVTAAAAVVAVSQPPADSGAQTVTGSSVKIPRFSLQLLRSGPCLVLADLPLGEAFQSSDPDFQLLRDLLRAAGLPVEVQFLRQGEPVRWPLLTSGQLVGEQDDAAARACVRDLLEFECSQAAVRFVWLLGPQAVAFANREEEAGADVFSLSAFQSGIRFWNLPALEQLMQERPLKPLLWQHMQELMAHWSSHA